MQGKENLIDDILQSAKKTSAAMVEEAVNVQNAAIDALRAELEEARLDAEKSAKAAAQAAYAGRLKLGELEAGKIELRAKRECVSAVYAAVREKILGLPDGEYLKLMQKLIAANAEDGDEIIAAKRDSKRINAAWVKKISTALKKKLSLSKEQGDFDGGVVLRNAKYDRDLSVDEIISDLTEKTESGTVSALDL